MKVQCYSMFDKKAGAFSQPFYARSKGEAMRTLMATLDNKESSIAQFPQDFSLFYIADWDDSIGSYTPAVGGATEVCTALELVYQRRADDEIADANRLAV